MYGYIIADDFGVQRFRGDGFGEAGKDTTAKIIHDELKEAVVERQPKGKFTIKNVWQIKK